MPGNISIFLVDLECGLLLYVYDTCATVVTSWRLQSAPYYEMTLAIRLADQEPTFDPSRLWRVIITAVTHVGLRQRHAIKLRELLTSL
jgi:hypothetical protein